MIGGSIHQCISAELFKPLHTFVLLIIAVSFLQDAGSLIHVSDHTYRLTNVYFLDPAWLCSVLYAVVQLHDDYYLQDGMIPKSRLEELCEKSGFGRERFEEYLQLLMRFEIALPVGLNRYNAYNTMPGYFVKVYLDKFFTRKWFLNPGDGSFTESFIFYLSSQQ